VLEISVIRSEFGRVPSSNRASLLYLHSSRQRDAAHRPIGTGQLRARRRFAYWGEQIDNLRDQSGQHFLSAPAELEPETAG
jgi:hypothetical protein